MINSNNGSIGANSLKNLNDSDTLISSKSDEVSAILDGRIQDMESWIEKIPSLKLQLEEFDFTLAKAQHTYYELFDEEFDLIEAALAKLDYLEENEVLDIDMQNIEVSSLFSNVNISDNAEASLYNSLLERLKSKNPLIQAHLLGFIDLMQKYFTNKAHNNISPDDMPKKTIFNNPQFGIEYKRHLSKIFDAMDNYESDCIEVSKLLHRGGKVQYSKQDIVLMYKFIAYIH